MEKNFEWSAMVSAIRNSFTECSDYVDRYRAGHTIIEMLTAIGFEDDEIVELLGQAAGNDSETDDFIDEMINNIEA
ncbi:Uncharacterised protein [Serratia ficaria]|uniref:hypothetical protein n=1 Tax=Serratia ficaria TaxID=61651 RepID=UPI002179254C|nr:hypothetical protein [Serratia ficaria]CAI1105543.1 Uncharacterised protein [Serratia ficaria]CAI1940092.1 Uncharacterised protein [Serratia ficaria]CAI2465190.1 Uncharacterised protein [Serratia ficaria]CAI2787738.1 Uncharacterised protein [Serratia ficaria]